MRILVLTNMYPPHHLGGYELTCRDAVARWRSKGHDVSILTSDVRFEHATTDDDPLVARELKMYWRDGLIIDPPVPQRIAIERHNAKVLDRTLAAFEPDVVSAWHMGAMSLSLITQISLRGVPIVAVLGDAWLDYGPTVDGWIRMFRTRPWARRIAERLTGVPTVVAFGPHDTLCFASDWLRRRTEERSSLTLPARREIVPVGIDLSVFSGGDDERPWRWRLLVAGRIEARKGVHVALEALGRLPAEATLDIVGPPDDTGYTDGLHRRAAELGVADRIRWAGPVSRDELAEAFRSTDVFVFPVVWDEPFGMVPLEAMACGAPVIATGTGGSGEFLDHERNCIRVEREDATGIEMAVRRLAADEGFRRTLAAAGRQTAERFSDLRYYDELEDQIVAVAALTG